MPLRFRFLVLTSFVFALLSLRAESASWRVVRDEFIEPAPAVPEVHASTIVEAGDGSLVASWFGGSKEGNDDIDIWVSRFERGAWTTAVVAATGEEPDGRRYPTWNPVLHRADDGRLILFIKVGPSPEKWWGEFLVSHDHGRTWGERQKLPDGVLGPIKNKAVRLADGTIVSPSSFEYDAKHWAVRIERTDAQLRRWTVSPDVADPQRLGAIQPSILVHADGRLQALCRSSVRQLVQTWSTDGGVTWSPLEPTQLFMPNSGLDAVTLRDGGFLLVYNPSPKDANPKSWGERRPLVVAHSDDGLAWTTILTLETAPNRHGYAYPAVIQSGDGRVHITYTWNRARIKHVVLEAR
ncbi:MAG TPA: sialidase family protein [Opitutus sp.]|nr:sialidase family protein [Opitutus sp.]